MTMTGLFVRRNISILAAVWLLVVVMSSPVRSPASHPTGPSRGLPRGDASPKLACGGQLSMSARLFLKEAHVFRDEIEDEREDDLIPTSPPAPVCFNILSARSPDLHSSLASLAAAFAARPLRC